MSVSNWRQELTERERAEIDLALFYAKNPHGTDGHGRLLLIAKLVDLLGELDTTRLAFVMMRDKLDKLEKALK